MLRALDAAPGAMTLSSVLGILSSGVMWGTEVKQGLLRHMPQVVLADSFGSSEAVGFGLSMMTAQGEVETARFQIGDNVKVFTPEGREVAPGSGEVGMIARGDPLPEGYYKDPAKTEATFRTFGGVRYSIPGISARSRPTGRSPCWAGAAAASTPPARRCFPRRWRRFWKLHPDVEDALVVGTPDDKMGPVGHGRRRVAHRGRVRRGRLAWTHARAPGGLQDAQAPDRGGQHVPRPNGKADYKAAREWALRELGMGEGPSVAHAPLRRFAVPLPRYAGEDQDRRRLIPPRSSRGRGTPKGWRGRPLQRSSASTPDNVSSVQHVRRRETHRPDTRALQPPIALQIVPQLVRMDMGGPVDLDRQPRRRTVEIQDIGPNRVLTAKPQFSEPPFSEMMP